MKKIILLCVLYYQTVVSYAQKENPTMAEKVFTADYIFEGRPIGGGYNFKHDKTTMVTVNYVIITKEFKGNFTSDTAKIITVSGAEVPTDGPHYMGNSEGLFFCVAVPKGALPINTDNSFFIYSIYGYIGYENDRKFMSHRGTPVYPNVREYLYDSLEMVLGKKYDSIGPTMLEIETKKFWDKKAAEKAHRDSVAVEKK